MLSFVGIMSVSGITKSTCCLHYEATCYCREVFSRLPLAILTYLQFSVIKCAIEVFIISPIV
jgi:hypothetical protein